MSYEPRIIRSSDTVINDGNYVFTFNKWATNAVIIMIILLLCVYFYYSNKVERLEKQIPKPIKKKPKKKDEDDLDRFTADD